MRKGRLGGPSASQSHNNGPEGTNHCGLPSLRPIVNGRVWPADTAARPHPVVMRHWATTWVYATAWLCPSPRALECSYCSAP
eukprot:scaffold175913_cov34-Tisochrysis_lutea.AAC.3